MLLDIIELECLFCSRSGQIFVLRLKVTKTAHTETDHVTLFIIVIASHSCSFSSCFEFSKETHTQHLNSVFFEGTGSV
jgi:hypothetical protein